MACLKPSNVSGRCEKQSSAGPGSDVASSVIEVEVGLVLTSLLPAAEPRSVTPYDIEQFAGSAVTRPRFRCSRLVTASSRPATRESLCPPIITVVQTYQVIGPGKITDAIAPV